MKVDEQRADEARKAKARAASERYRLKQKNTIEELGNAVKRLEDEAKLREARLLEERQRIKVIAENICNGLDAHMQAGLHPVHHELHLARQLLQMANANAISESPTRNL